MDLNHFTNTLLKWYPLNKRPLPWRDTHNPYIIWLSEIILQQTRVAQGLPYFQLFLKRFPRVESLAAASEDEILRCWQGLGYYSRARNLHACAKSIVRDYNGKFPDNYKELLALKGVGTYTAAAIASFAFGERIAVLDGNVFRVLGRYFGISLDISSQEGKREFEKLANLSISENFPDIYNQAIMEFGALQCIPKNPNCTICPLSASCYAKKEKLVHNLPVKLKKTKVKTRSLLYHHIECDEFTLVKKRISKDIWQGLVDFPLEERSSLENLTPDSSVILKEMEKFEPLVDISHGKLYKHTLSHQKIYSKFTKVIIKSHHQQRLLEWAKEKNYLLVSENELEEMGKPKLIVRYLNDIK